MLITDLDMRIKYFLLPITKFKYISKNYKDAEIPRKTDSISAAIIVWKYLGLYLEYKVNQ